MECPKYIREALLRRANHASAFLDLDWMIAEWLEKNGVEVESEDIHGGCESYVNPYESSRRILKAIEETDNGKHQ